MNERIAELEKLISVALEQRKAAYKLGLTQLRFSINADLRNWKNELAELKVGA